MAVQRNGVQVKIFVKHGSRFFSLLRRISGIDSYGFESVMSAEIKLDRPHASPGSHDTFRHRANFNVNNLSEVKLGFSCTEKVCFVVYNA